MKILLLAPLDTPLRKVLETDNQVFITDGRVSFELAAQFDFLISYNYRYILLKEMLDLFPGKAVNLHISYLPYNRGADPNFWSLFEGTPRGVTIHNMDAGIDTGDILLQKEVEFCKGDTLATSYNKLHNEILELFSLNKLDILSGNIKARSQDGKGSYHNSADKGPVFELLRRRRENVWDTPIQEVIDLGNASRQE